MTLRKSKKEFYGMGKRILEKSLTSKMYKPSSDIKENNSLDPQSDISLKTLQFQKSPVVSMKERRVLVIYGSADLYGASKNLIRSLRGFQLLGWSSITVLPHDGPLVKLIEAEGSRVLLMEHGVIRRQNLSPAGLIKLSRELYSSYKQLSKLIKSEKIDLIYSNSNSNIIGGILRKTHQVQHIWHIHEIIAKPKWFGRLIEFYIKKTEDSVLCVSEAVRNNLPHIKPEKLKLLYNGINISQFEKADYDLKAELGLSNEKILIGMVARVNKWKGQFYFLEIASLLHKKYPNLHFVMAGDTFTGYEFLYKEIKESIQKLGLGDVVSDIGFRADVADVLSGIDIFALPSILPDPLPTTVLEAMAAGKPVIATNQGGATEMVIEGETGFLIPWDNPEVAVKAFEKLLDSPTLRQKFGSAGHKRASTFFNQEKYLATFAKLVSQV